MAVGNWTICQANSTRTLYNIPTVMPAITVTLIYRVHNEGPAAVNVVPPDTGSVIRLDPGESCDVVGAPWINVALAGLPRCSAGGNAESAKGTYELIYGK